LKTLKDLIRRESITILLALGFTGVSFVLFAMFRQFDTKTFSFLQIIVVTIFVAALVYVLSQIQSNKFNLILRGRELAIVLTVFTLLSFAILNIDRSRSFYLIKWVSISGDSGISTEDIAKRYGLSGRDFSDLGQRVEEQKESGSIVENDGKLHLTLLGKFVANVSTLIANFANLSGYPRS
jgi:hypothetical protein